MVTGQPRTRKLLGSPLAALLCSLLLLSGDGLLPLPCLTLIHVQSTSEEEAPPGKSDSSDTRTDIKLAGTRHRPGRHLSHGMPPGYFPLTPAHLPASRNHSLAPRPRERDRLNGVGAPLRC
jgi:hypothetical protein